MKHIKHFENYSDFENIKDSIVRPAVAFVEDGSIVEYLSDGQPGGGGSDEPEVDPSNGHEYVDLSLPSGLKWATCNIGATKPEEYGLYFAWGEIDGYSDAKSGKAFKWSDYDHGTSSYYMTKYNSTDGLTILELTDDAARVNMGGNWRMPTYDECIELINNTKRAWTTENGVNEMKFTSRSDASKSIFVPASGYCRDGSVNDAGSYGGSWGSLLDSSNVGRALSLGFSSSSAHTGNSNRCYGRPVRGVLA